MLLSPALKKYSILAIFLLSVVGAADSFYLTLEHYSKTIPPCQVSIFVDCGKVLKSKYSEVFGVPLSLYGFFYYVFISAASILAKFKPKSIYKAAILAVSTFGFLFSIYLMYLQFFVIGSICLYCTLSAFVSALIFFVSLTGFPKERVYLAVKTTHTFYKYFAKQIFFLINPEVVHESIVTLGEHLGNSKTAKKLFSFFFQIKSNLLKQKIKGVAFENPVGLAAGYDYDAKLVRFLPFLGFGFQTVGTITNIPYGGNPKPMLGRLPKSKSLMVNKGFKSIGAKKIADKLRGNKFDIPIGISIGRSNSAKVANQKKSIDDVISSFKIFEKANVKNAYYELNISCPNLIHGNVSFYPPKNLDELLTQVDNLKLKKPVFIKMPIEKENSEILSMLEVISKHKIDGVIFGNLQKDRNHKSLDKDEVAKFKTGFFSGKPTFERSNELISLAYKNFGGKLIIIGCGGIFSADDAFEKIVRGANLVQLITGMVYEGPQLISQINLGLEEKLKLNGFKNIADAVGSFHKTKKHSQTL
jgi:dihydroorotate dehydrogenase